MDGARSEPVQKTASFPPQPTDRGYVSLPDSLCIFSSFFTEMPVVRWYMIPISCAV